MNESAPAAMIPEFAILGHPNEGKSSVLSTLAEDDSVRISATPGETKRCRTFPVIIDGREIIRFTDTPGFQNPRRILHELEQYHDKSDDRLSRFFEDHENDEEMRDDCELMRPLLRGAGIIYVADGSRPLRHVDLAEMEILRLTGKPRMAILNCKNTDDQFLEQWKKEFRKTFNSSRLFNAHNATYAERIQLLEALKSIEQDWQAPLEYVVASFKKDWQARNEKTVDIICEMLSVCLTHNQTGNISHSRPEEEEKQKLFLRYQDDIKKLEQKYHRRIRALFKHNIFDYTLPPHSILHEDLFSRQTWNFLGLKKRQLALAGGAGGAALAATLDLAAGGTSLGLFTTLGGIAGALGAVYGGENIASKVKIIGVDAARMQLQVGPNRSSQFPYILLDRVLLYYAHVINWAHGRRDYENAVGPDAAGRGYTSAFSADALKICQRYFRSVQKNENTIEIEESEFKEIILAHLNSLSHKKET